MKKLRLMEGIPGSVFLLTGVAFSTFAQVTVSPPVVGPVSVPTLPVVTIRATDPVATWSGHPGMFTVFRSGNPAPSLNVYYDIGGTATNGVDYRALSHWVQIPSGVLSGDIVINPINQGQASTKTVVLTLTNSPLLAPRYRRFR